jgi:hypothetical protein
VSVVSRIGGTPKLYKLTLKGDVARLPVTTLKKALQAFTAMPAQDMVLTKDGQRLEDYMVGADVQLVPGSVLHLDINGGVGIEEVNVGRGTSAPALPPMQMQLYEGGRGQSPVTDRIARDEFIEFGHWSPRRQVQYMSRMKSDIDSQLRRLDRLHSIWSETINQDRRITPSNAGRSGGRTGSVGAYQFTDYRAADSYGANGYS